MKPTGLPHSEIPGYASTRLTEAYRSVATSFIGPRRQGIHPAPLLVCTHADQGFGPQPARWRTGPEVWGGTRSRRCCPPPGEAGGPPNADSRNADTAYGGIPKHDVDKNLCGWKGTPSAALEARATAPVNPRSAPAATGADRESRGQVLQRATRGNNSRVVSSETRTS